jgi:hypothetical protein
MPTLLTRLLGGGLVAVLVVAVVLLGLPGSPPESSAEPSKTVDIRYIYVTGEGATAKAWFDGAPSPGISVQDALDKFGEQGYRVAMVTDNLRSTEDNVAFTILLQRLP